MTNKSYKDLTENSKKAIVKNATRAQKKAIESGQKKRLTLVIESELYDELEAYRVKHELSKTHAIRLAIKNFIHK